MPITTRKATPTDANAIARIYNEGIEDRIATFETRPRSAEDVARWFDGVHPAVVVEDAGRIVGFASTSPYRPRECYTRPGSRGSPGRCATRASRGRRARPPGRARRGRGARALGFREVGVYAKHGQLD